MEKIIKIGRVPLKIFFLLILNDVLDTAAQLLMKKGLGTADLHSIPGFFHHLLNPANPLIFLFWIGVVIYLGNFFLWIKILCETDLSIALPLASAGYILIPVAAVFFLHEFVPPLRWLGLAFIIFGVYFVSQSGSKQPGERT
jgi:drug/metabolite transporter (DMT)-like permease